MQNMYTKDNASLLNTKDTVKCSSTKENTSSKLRSILTSILRIDTLSGFTIEETLNRVGRFV